MPLESSIAAGAQPPIAAKKPHRVTFGYVSDEDRGPNPMNPPRYHDDPYFWMRDDDRKDLAVIQHLKEEKAYFEARTADIASLRDVIYTEHISHIKEDDMSAPYVNGQYRYYTREVKGKSYKIYCRVARDKEPGDTAAEEVILDVNQVAEGKPFCDVKAVESAPPKHDLVAFSVDMSGNEVYTIEFKSMSNPTTQVIADKVSGTNGKIVWGFDHTSIFYVTKDDTLRDNKVWRHVMGKPQSDDVCLYEEKNPLFSAFMYKAADANTLIVGSESSETTEVHLLDLRKGNTHNTLEIVRPREKGVRYDVDMHGTSHLLILTNEGGAVNHKLLMVPREQLSDWSRVLVEHSEDIFMESVAVRSRYLVVAGRRAGLTRIWTMTVDPQDGVFKVGTELREVEMKEPIFTVHLVESQMVEYEESMFRMEYSSLATPNTWFDVNPHDHSRTAVKVREVGGGFDAANYKVERRFATAPDQAKIPISIVYHKDLDMSQPQPCMLYGYGSYGISMDPQFSIQHLPYCDRGMIFAIAHIRGGSEMGRAWYEIGAKYLTKRNTFSDFISAAECLIDAKLTTPSQLACEGRSAGGLLVGAVLNMRPDLFKVALAGVPFVDVMTTMCDPSIPLTTGEWEEWGNPNEYKYYDYMLSYSPVDNVRAQEYPNIMVQCGLHDPRVAYWEPAKWVSKLRAYKTDGNEILLNMDMESGHFSAKDRYKFWKESAIQQAFVCKHLKSTVRLLARR
ncbi:oligopeptidase b [Leishmania tarentolae]|uniref:Prolyl endopeptidase n=1 Tax=Leishmania tarentolae TaxID=5689 RepID=A0A640KB03_LEITA|nr:oligopeptidase b [Leishmania tarentolae]